MPPKLPPLRICQPSFLSHSPTALTPRLPPCTLVLRPLSTTPPLRKKGGGGKKEQKRTVEVNAAKTASNDDARDFSGFKSEIEKAIEYLKVELSKLKAGGLDLDAIEGLRVSLGAGKGAEAGRGREKGKGEMVRVGDVAQVVPRGRVVVVMVGERDHVKHITSALQTSSLSLQPLPPASNATAPGQQLEIHIPIPPTTTESRQAASAQASSKGEAALFALNQARAVQKKRLRALSLARKVGPDELKKAEREMEKINKDSEGVVGKIVEEKKRALMGS